MRLGRIETVKDSRCTLLDLFDPGLSFDLPLAELENSGNIVYYQATDSAESAEIIRLFASAGSARATIYNALSTHGLDPEFPASVLLEVKKILQEPAIDDPALVDLSHLPFITIDNIDSRDLDQAMHLSMDEGEGITLHYALADAAYYVKPGTALFKRALERGASYYVPGLSVPMLPRDLSEGLISLNPDVFRRALIFKIRFNPHGNVLESTVFQARIKSVAKLSYSGVEQYYIDPEKSPCNRQPYTRTLDLLRQLGQLRIALARDRQVVEYNRSGIEIEQSDTGESFVITDTDRLSVERYNEQVSLVCNSEGARLLQEAGLPSVVQAVYRVHDAPDEERLKKYSRLLQGLIKEYQLDPELWVWRWRDGRFGKKETLAAFIERLQDNKVNHRLLAAVQRHALMLSPASRFSADAGVHHSLKLDQYARFSSPMREIAGIFTHREMLQYQSIMGDTVTAGSRFDDEELRLLVIAAANRSKEIQKKLNKAVLKTAIDQLFRPELSKTAGTRTIFTGTVVSLRSTRVYVHLDTPEIIVKLYLKELAELTGISYKLDKSGAVTINAASKESVFRIGQSLALQTSHYSDDIGRWLLVPVEPSADQG